MLCVLGVVFAIVSGLQVQAGRKSSNVPEYRAICRIFLIAKDFTKDLDVENYIQERIGWPRATKHLSTIRQLLVDLDDNASGTIKLSEDSALSIRTGSQRRLARERIHSLSSFAKRIEGVINETRKQAVDKYGEVRTGMLKVLGLTGMDQVGELGSKLHDFEVGGSTYTRTNVCKDPDGTSNGKAGRHVPGDLMCLCADQTQSTQDGKCGFAAAGSTNVWATSAATYNDVIWKAIYEDCIHQKIESDPTVEGINAAIALFEQQINRQAASAVTLGVGGHRYLGSVPASGATCDGTATYGVCVDYGGPKSKKIKWLQNLIGARDYLRQMNELIEQAKANMTKIEKAAREAESTVIFANLSQHFPELTPSPAHPKITGEHKNTEKSPENPTVQGLNAVNTMPTTRFILPWILFI